MPLLPYAASARMESQWLSGLKRIERRPTQQLLSVYGAALRDIEAEAGRFIERIAVAKSFAGVSATAALDVQTLQFRLELLNSRKASIVDAIRQQTLNSGLEDAANSAINGSASPAYKFGIKAGLHRMEGIVVAHHQINREFAERALAKFHSPTNARLWVENMADRNAQAVVDTLTKGVLLGHGPEEMTRAVRGSLNATTSRVSTFVRTEVIGAARKGSLDAYRENADVVTAWIWNAADDACAVCWGMNGSLHPLDEEMDSHPNCRCSADPATAPMADLKAGDVPADGSQGIAPFDPDARFSQLPEGQQMRALGPTRLRAFKAGRLKLRDIPAPTNHPHWGPGLRAKSLRELGIEREVANAAAVAPSPAPPAFQAQESGWLGEIAGMRQQAGPLGLPPSLRQAVPNENFARLGREAYNAALADAESVMAPQVEQVIKAGEVMQTELRSRVQAAIDADPQMRAAHAEHLQRLDIKIADTEQMLSDLKSHPQYRGKKADVRKVSMRLRELQGEREAYAAGTADQRREAVMQMMRDLREMGDGQQGARMAEVAASRSRAEVIAQVGRMSELVPRTWLDAMREWAGNGGLTIGRSSRGYFSEYRRHLMVSANSSAAGLMPGDSTALHEMIHWAEQSIPALRELEWSFYRRRTTANGVREKTVSLRTLKPGHGYGANEKVREDHFSEAYMGKDYGDGPQSFYEVMTMGMESVMGTDYRPMIDANHEQFVLGVLAMLL